MKKMIVSAAALAMISSAPAFAQDVPVSGAGGDGIATFNIAGSAANFCKLGAINSSSVGEGNNTTVDYTTANGSGNSGGTSDAMIGITQLQDSNDHAAAWSANITMANSVCNTAYTVTANSANGGLAYQGAQTGSSDFAKKLAYDLSASFGNHNGSAKSARNMQDGATLLNVNKATAGNFVLNFDGAADTSKYLLSGDYTDQVVVTMTPNTGESA